MKTAELSFDEFLESKMLWEDALRKNIDNHVFLTWEWLSNWWKHFGSERELHLITLMNEGKILAAAPLMHSKYSFHGFELKKMEFVATPISDYHTFLLTEKNYEHVKLMIEHAKYHASDWDCAELTEIPWDSQTANILNLLSEKFKFRRHTQNICPYLRLSTGFDDFISKLSPRFRHKLRGVDRKLKKEYRLGFRICNNTYEIKNDMRAFFDLHDKRWRSKKRPGALASQRLRNFHLDVAEAFAQRGWLILSFITLNDSPVASIYGFVYEQKLYFYLSGLDPEYSQYGVGDLIQLYLIKHSIEHGLKEFDFMRGDELYKHRWNALTRYNLEVWTTKQKLIPIAYNWITKNNRFSSLATRTSAHACS